MAPNHLPRAAGSSSSDEEVEESSEENESQSESEEETNTSTPSPKKPRVPTKLDTKFDDESGSESDPPEPIASRPREDLPKPTTKKLKSKPNSALQKPAEKENNSKRVKKKLVDSDTRAVKVVEKATAVEEATAVGSDSKKQLFQRLWSEDDEIEILKGVMEYRTKKGVDPMTDMEDFHDFIKKKLHVAVTRTQLYYKLRRLKKKYQNNAGKGKNGVDRSFLNPHEQKAYDLSKKVWGGEAVGDSVKLNGKAKKNQNQNQNQNAIVALPMIGGAKEGIKIGGAKEGIKIEVEKSAGVSRAIGMKRSSLEEEIILDGLDLIGGSKKLELEEKWKKLKMEEMTLYLKRVDLIREQTKLVLEAMK